MSKIVNFTLTVNQELENYLETQYPEYGHFRLLSQSLDARRANKGRTPQYNYRVEISQSPLEHQDYKFSAIDYQEDKPLIIGAGPAGLFCALRLMEYGIPSIIIERGAPAKKRMLAIARFWRYGELDLDNNVCFGEGGAGLYSDGKLITRIKSPHIDYVMKRLVDFGAPEEARYLSNPHLGSNKIRGIISELTDYLKRNGCEFHYNSCVESVLTTSSKVEGVELRDGRDFRSPFVILATGHSAKNIYQDLCAKHVAMKAKDFSIGVRIEHSRSYLDKLQYGKWAGDKLGAARYAVKYHDKQTYRGVYSFCMCPGGVVLSSGTEANGLVVNGMSNYGRNSPWSNSALVVTTKSEEEFAEEDLFAGLKFQEKIEQRAFDLSKEFATGKEIPAITVGELLDGKVSKHSLPNTSCPSGIIKADLSLIFPKLYLEELVKGLKDFERKLPGFSYEQALLLAPETRTSSAITILRDKHSLESSSHRGLFPAGEGAGHAGGITSAAVDGVKVAESIVQKILIKN